MANNNEAFEYAKNICEPNCKFVLENSHKFQNIFLSNKNNDMHDHFDLSAFWIERNETIYIDVKSIMLCKNCKDKFKNRRNGNYSINKSDIEFLNKICNEARFNFYWFALEQYDIKTFDIIEKFLLIKASDALKYLNINENNDKNYVLLTKDDIKTCDQFLIESDMPLFN